MPVAATSIPWQRAIVTLTTTVIGVVVVYLLYWAQVVFIPLALAVFFTFMLSPPVMALQRRGLGRVYSVATVVAGAALVLAIVGWVVLTQVRYLVAELPKHTETIKKKVNSLREMTKGQMAENLGWMVREITGEVEPNPDEDRPTADPEDKAKSPLSNKATRVVVQPDSPPWLSRLPQKLTGVLEPLSDVALAVILAIFMLLKREDLRNRFIRLVGHGQMTVTTKAVDDAGARISRYLIMQVLINGGYGLVWGIGLWIIGIEYPLLWGFLAALGRYIPYIGTPVLSLLPITLSLVMFEGWTHVILVVALMVTMELVTANAIEPWLYGQSIGVSEVALLFAAALWAFLWGPIGLVLSGPLTVCLVVLGRYVPLLDFFAVLLGDEPALEPRVAFYQRLLAGDQEEAEELALASVKTSSPEQVYDDLLLPSLSFTKRDRRRDLLTAEEEQFVLRATGEMVEELAEQQVAEQETPTNEKDAKTNGTAEKPLKKIHVLGWAARDESDRLALEMLGKTLDPKRWDLEIASGELLVAQLLSLIEEKKPAVFCIGAIPPGGMAHTRYLCKRLKVKLPGVKIVVGRWGQRGNVDSVREELQQVGADLVETTLVETRNQLTAWLPVLEQPEIPATSAGIQKPVGSRS